jgi:hypothetical protein
MDTVLPVTTTCYKPAQHDIIELQVTKNLAATLATAKQMRKSACWLE